MITQNKNWAYNIKKMMLPEVVNTLEFIKAPSNSCYKVQVVQYFENKKKKCDIFFVFRINCFWINMNVSFCLR